MEQICHYDKCFGCSICAGICPTLAITMLPKELGHIHPIIDQSKCIDCKKCERYCPVNNVQPLHLPTHTYAAWATNKEQHHSSSSGGLSACLADYIIDLGGVVYGCASLPKGKIEHIRVEDKESSFAIKGSKYVHSHISREVVQSILSDLKNGEKVLFIGTPCQVAAVKSIGKPYEENLFCVDLICHGVPSQEFLFRYIGELGISRESISNISFRSAENNFFLVAYSDGIYKEEEHHDLYYMAFNNNLSFRQSCYTCPFANSKRVGDLTIGDFWGLGKTTPFNYKAGGNISVVLVNSEKGHVLIYHLMENGTAKFINRDLSEAVDGNHNLHECSKPRFNCKIDSVYEKQRLIPGLKRILLWPRIKGFLLPLVQMILRIIYRFK